MGSGPSASIAIAAAFRGRAKVLAINTSFRLAPWADALYACDATWWAAHPEALAFQGLKITHEAQGPGLHRIELLPQGRAANVITTATSGVIGRGQNGGFQGLNLAVQFGARRIAMAGLDFHGEHWHGRHPAPLRNAAQHSLKEWAGILDGEAPRLAALGVELINLSPDSLLLAYPKMTAAEVLVRWRR